MRKEMKPVDQMRVAVFLPDGGALSPYGKPLMLQEVLFCPVLTWCVRAWKSRGVERFFLVCEEPLRERGMACFPQGTDVTWLTPEEGEALGDDVEKVREPVMPRGEMMIAFHTAQELGRLQDAWHREIIEGHQRNGVLILDGAATYIDPRVTIAPGTLILPGTILRGETAIGEGCEIGPGAVVDSCIVEGGVTINASQVAGSTIGAGSDVGPYAHIRPGCQVGPKCHIGAFVQLKNCNLGEGTKMSHLTYVGDSDVGRGVNFGCGTVTSNYDGFKKHRTVIGDNVFIGCNTNLVAPVEVGEGAYIAAGTTVTKNVPADSLAVGRARQENKEGWARHNRAMKARNKKQ